VETPTSERPEQTESGRPLWFLALLILVGPWAVTSVIWGAWDPIFNPDGETGCVRLASAAVGIVYRTLSDALWSWRSSTPYQAETDYVFASPESGRRMNPDRWWNEHWKAALAAAGIDGRIRPFHDARHSALTHMAAGGSTPLAIMATAGHASMVTMKRYLHLAGVTFKDDATALEQRLLGEKSSTRPN
jgi:hypothetical protein